ncbi:MAG: hypothetical protein M0R17_03500 [Candidatus Omnitrophica bacterium]|jgi:hypothetical protein|nr:hypothetical protein [Candidatus Omnitrophota bacterium]
MNKKLVFGLTTVLGTVAGVLLTKLAITKIKDKKNSVNESSEASHSFEDAPSEVEQETPGIINPNNSSKRILPKLRPQHIRRDESDGECCVESAG